MLRNRPVRLAALTLILAVAVLPTSARTLRLFSVGNSFSNNATRLLPELAKSGGHELIIGRAVTGGCSFERHWNAVEAFLANPDDPKGRIYSGKSLWDNIRTDTWDVITVQQYSLHSTDYSTYQPFADKLHAHLRKLQPQAEIVIHQTWAYRRDAARFGQVEKGKHAADQREMWEKSRAAYWRLESDLRARVIPTGDAFWRVDSDPKWGYKVDPIFDLKAPVHPALPDQRNSLHVGYRWNAEKKFSMDANHANVAGEYLGALVWYGFLFNESPERLTFVPPGVAPEFAVHLRQVAWQVVQETAAESRRLAARPASTTTTR
jgi:hypothetical protein